MNTTWQTSGSWLIQRPSQSWPIRQMSDVHHGWLGAGRDEYNGQMGAGRDVNIGQMRAGWDADIGQMGEGRDADIGRIGAGQDANIGWREMVETMNRWELVETMSRWELVETTSRWELAKTQVTDRRKLVVTQTKKGGIWLRHRQWIDGSWSRYRDEWEPLAIFMKLYITEMLWLVVRIMCMLKFDACHVILDQIIFSVNVYSQISLTPKISGS